MAILKVDSIFEFTEVCLRSVDSMCVCVRFLLKTLLTVIVTKNINF